MASRTPAAYYLHLISWAQIGVLLRLYLAELLGAACPSLPWAPCVSSGGSRWGGALFADLPANVLGCFLMGLFVSSDVLSNSLKHVLTVEAPMAALPVRSPLQEHLALQVGLRTGLCGSLTTFASWLTQMVLMIVGSGGSGGGQTQGSHATSRVTVLQHSQWVEALGGLLVGTLAAMAALVLGQHCALLLYHKLNPGAFIPYGSPAPEQIALEGLDQQQQQQQEQEQAATVGSLQLRTVSSLRQGSVTVVVVEEEEGGADQQQQQQQRQQQHSSSLPGALELSAAGQQQKQWEPPPPAAAAAAEAVAAGDDVVQAGRAGSGSKQGLGVEGGGVAANGVAAAAAVGGDSGGVGLISRNSSSSSSSSVLVEEVDEVEAPSVSAAQVAVDAFAVLTIAALTGVSLWRIIQGNTQPGSLPTRDHLFAQEFFWWSVLLGPLGCYGRYYLSRFNGRLPGAAWKWFPAGTFAANMAACCIDYVMKAVPVRHPLDRTSAAVLAGAVGGVGGCLSTVSTWVVEIQRLLLSFPKTSHGYQYVFLSLGSALAAGLLLYGVPVWTA